MTRETAEFVAEVAALLARHTYTLDNGKPVNTPPHVAAREAMKLARVARSLHRLAERNCCEDLDGVYGEGYYERTDTRLENKARAIVARFPGLEVEFQGDPRGWPIILMSHAPNTSAEMSVTPHA